MTVGCDTSERGGRSDGTVRSTCKATACIRFPGQLEGDLCTLAVNVIPSLLYSRRDHHQFTASSRTDHTSLLGNGSRLGCGPSPLVLLSIYGRGQSFTVAQLPCRRLFLRRIPKSASLDIEFIVRESSTFFWSYTYPLPYTASASRTYTYDNKNKIQ